MSNTKKNSTSDASEDQKKPLLISQCVIYDDVIFVLPQFVTLPIDVIFDSINRTIEDIKKDERKSGNIGISNENNKDLKISIIFTKLQN